MAGPAIKVEILADPTQYKRALGEVDQATETAGQKLSGFAKVAVAALAVAALAAVKKFAQDSLRAFSDLNESLNAVEVTFGDAAEGIKKLGEEGAQAIGASNSEFNGYAVSISAFAKQIAGEGGDVVRTVDTLSKRTADFASVMNLDFGEASEKFRSGMAGQSEPLREFGIDVSAAKVEAVALAEGIWDGTGAMTEAEKVQARYSTIMEQTSAVQGDFARTAGDAANKQRILDAELENNKALLGQAILPLQQTWQGIMADAIPIIADLAIELGRFTGALTDAEAALLGFKTEEGHAVETADELLGAITELGSGSALADWVAGVFDMTAKTEDWVAAMVEGIETAGLSQEELHRLGLELGTLHEAGDLTDQQFQDLNDTLETQKNRQEQLERPISDNERALYGMSEAETALREETALANEETQTQIDLLKAAADPVFAAQIAIENLRTAQENLAEVQADTTASTEDLAAAELAMVEALFDAQGAMDALTPEALNAAIASIQTATGKSREEVIALLEQLGILEGGVTTHFVDIHYRETGKGSGSDQRFYNIPKHHEGGVVAGPRGSDQLIVAKGGETVLPTHKGGSPVPGANGAGTIININVTALDPNAAAKAVVQAIEIYKRNNGGRLPF